jgi:hypothetical protein
LAPPLSANAARGRVLQLMKFDRDGGERWFREIYFDTSDLNDFRLKVKAFAKADNLDPLKRMLLQLAQPGRDANCFHAASLVKWYLTKYSLTPIEHPDNLPLTVGHLLRQQWWKLFVDASEHTKPGSKQDGARKRREIALAFDNDKSPGYFNMMQTAFETVLTGPLGGPTPTFAAYDNYHTLVTRGVKAKVDGDFEDVPHKLSGGDVRYPMTLHGGPSVGAVRELISERIAGLDRDQTGRAASKALLVAIWLSKHRDVDVLKPTVQKGIPNLDALLVKLRGGASLDQAEKSQAITIGFRLLKTCTPDDPLIRSAKKTYKADQNNSNFASRFKKVHVRASGVEQWLVKTEGDQNRANPLVTSVFAQYNNDIARAVSNDDRIKAICKAVRALHTAHVYVDANGRLNTMLLLNKLLMQQRLSPVIMADTSVFGGSKSLDELVGLVKTGALKFAAALSQ